MSENEVDAHSLSTEITVESESAVSSTTNVEADSTENKSTCSSVTTKNQRKRKATFSRFSKTGKTKKTCGRNSKERRAEINYKYEENQFIKNFKFPIGCKQLSKDDAQDSLKNRSVATSITAKKKSFRSHSSSSVPAEVMKNKKLNKDMSVLKM